MAGSEKDAGFCSGADEDDMSGLHSPSASEDSVEVQVTAISLRNKRKLAEPRRLQEPSTAPLKKRRFEQIEEEPMMVVDEDTRTLRSPSPFRPWSTTGRHGGESKVHTVIDAPPAIVCAGTPSAEATPTVSSRPIAVSEAMSPRIPAAIPLPLLSSASFSNALPDSEGRKRQEAGEAKATARAEAQAKTEAASEEMTVAEGQGLGRGEDEGRCEAKLAELSRRFADSARGPCLASLGQHRAQTSGPHRRESRLRSESSTTSRSGGSLSSAHPRLQEEPLSLVLRGELPRVPSHPAVSGAYERTSSYTPTHHDSPPPSLHQHQHQHRHQHQHQHQHQYQHQHQHQHQHPHPCEQPTVGTAQANHSRQHQGGGQQRNYKNMTRERRIEANARERTRVHTISAAFDTLRRAIPAYSHNQKLSKLSVLRIACSYIMTLGKIVDTPEGESANGASLGACVDLVSRTIQTEGKLRKRKED